MLIGYLVFPRMGDPHSTTGFNTLMSDDFGSPQNHRKHPHMSYLRIPNLVFFSCLGKKYLFDPKRRKFLQSTFFVFSWFCCPWWLNFLPLESLCSPWPVRPPPHFFFAANVCPAGWTVASSQLRKVPCMATLLDISAACRPDRVGVR